MKSTDVKNWRSTGKYADITNFEDFEDLLLRAVANGDCLVCGGDKVNRAGLCPYCNGQQSGADEVARKRAYDTHRVMVHIEKV